MIGDYFSHRWEKSKALRFPFHLVGFDRQTAPQFAEMARLMSQVVCRAYLIRKECPMIGQV